MDEEPNPKFTFASVAKGEFNHSLIHESTRFADDKSINLMLTLYQFHLENQK